MFNVLVRPGNNLSPIILLPRVDTIDTYHVHIMLYFSVAGSQVSTSAYETMYEDDFLQPTEMPWLNPSYKAATLAPVVLMDTDDARSDSSDVRRGSMASSMKESMMDSTVDVGYSDDNVKVPARGRTGRRVSEDAAESIPRELNNVNYLKEYGKPTTSPSGECKGCA